MQNMNANAMVNNGQWQPQTQGYSFQVRRLFCFFVTWLVCLCFCREKDHKHAQHACKCYGDLWTMATTNSRLYYIFFCKGLCFKRRRFFLFLCNLTCVFMFLQREGSDTCMQMLWWTVNNGSHRLKVIVSRARLLLMVVMTETTTLRPRPEGQEVMGWVVTVLTHLSVWIEFLFMLNY